MATQDLTAQLNAAIATLSDAERAAVVEFVQFLKQGKQKPSDSFLSAVEEFAEQHPALLQRLAR